MIIRSRAPLRLGLAGGGTDVSPYSDKYGGAVINATISLFAYSTIIPRDDGKIILNSLDYNICEEYNSELELEIDGVLDIHKSIYNRVLRKYNINPLSFELVTFVQAPPGSGLGSSSTLVVSILGAFVEWLNLPLDEYEIAKEAYEIERIELKMAGGKQDQYAAAFGGVNYMEFQETGKVLVHPLRIKRSYLNELEIQLLLFHTAKTRNSSDIIEKLSENVDSSNKISIDAMHNVKKQANMMKEAVLKGNIDGIGEILNYGWENKKKMAKGITNKLIDDIYNTAINAGSTGGRISGAGGGGFMIIHSPINKQFEIMKALEVYEGNFTNYRFVLKGLTTWSLPNEKN